MLSSIFRSVMVLVLMSAQARLVYAEVIMNSIGIDRVQFTMGDTMAEPCGYLAATQARDGNIQLITSKNHYVFNLAWLKQLPPAP